MIPLWQKNTRTLHESVVQLLPSTPPTDEHGRRLVDEARQLIDLVRLDGSWGVHNPRYTQELLNQARGKLMEARGPAATQPAASPATRPVSLVLPVPKGAVP